MRVFFQNVHHIRNVINIAVKTIPSSVTSSLAKDVRSILLLYNVLEKKVDRKTLQLASEEELYISPFATHFVRNDTFYYEICLWCTKCN